MPNRARDNSELRFADIASVNPRTPLNGLDPEAPVSFIPMADVDDGGRWATRQTRPLREVKTGYSPFADGDILFAKITPCTENGKGCHARDLTNGVGFGSTEFHVLRAKKGTDPRLVFHLAQSSDVRWKAAAVMDGSAGQQRVPADFFKICRIAPDILDNQDAKCDLFDAVDAAIDATRGVIEQTRRLKTAVLQDLLTRGLPGRHSEFAQHRWFSRLPRDWQLQRVEDIATRVTDGEHNTPPRSVSGVYLLSARNVLDGHLALDDVDYVTEDTYRALCRRIQPEHRDLLISCSGTVGRVCLVPRDTPVAMVRSVAIVKLNHSKVLPEFAHWAMRSQAVQRQIKVATSVLAQGNLFQEQIKALVLPVPGLDEQQQITNTMSAVDDRECNEVSKLRALALLKTALSQALLTGRVRVPANTVEAV